MVIKKYANRRLYNTATSSYVTLDDLSAHGQGGRDFVVFDAKTGEEITRAVLTQIIVEEEQKGQNLLPISFLRQLISLYGDSMQWLVPRYLEHAMATFARNQEQMRKNLQDTFGGLFPFGPLEEMGKQNLALFEKTMKMFSPFPVVPGATKPAEKPAETPAPRGRASRSSPTSSTTLQQQIDALGKDKKGRVAQQACLACGRRARPCSSQGGSIDGLAEIIALEEADAFAAQDRRLLGGLDAFGHGGEAEPARQADEMAQEDLVVVVLAEIAHEGAVDLDGVDGERLEVAQRGEAGAEIVERDAAAQLAQRSHEARAFLDVVQRRRLGDLDHQRGSPARACLSAWW